MAPASVCLTHSRRTPRGTARRTHRAFTLIELIVAGMVAVLVVGAVSMSLTQIGRSRAATERRLDAHMRATAALDALRRDISSALRSADLFDSRILITDAAENDVLGRFDRDEILLFSSRLNAVRPSKYQGEGLEYETQFRVASDSLGSALWQRRDPVPDRNPDGGGVAVPIVDGIVGLNLEAYDGESWYPDWDSDLYGLPWAIRVTVYAIGDPNGEVGLSPQNTLVTLRTLVALDRIVPPAADEPSKEEQAAIEAEEAAAAEAAAGAAGVGAADGDGAGGGRGGDSGLGTGGMDSPVIVVPGGGGGGSVGGGGGRGPTPGGPRGSGNRVSVGGRGSRSISNGGGGT